MKLYYYHIGAADVIYEKWKMGIFPGHTLYGLTHFEKYGIDCIVHKTKQGVHNRLWRSFYTLKCVLFCKEKYDVFYGMMFYGAELLIFLRAIGLYRKPILIWHHSAVVNSRNRFRNWLSCLFYKGIDEMFFFSENLLKLSLQTGKVKCGRVIPWGSDVDFYRYKQGTKGEYFISSGKENRDFRTLIKAFLLSGEKSEFYIPESHLGVNYKNQVAELVGDKEYPLLKIHFLEKLLPLEKIINSELNSFAVLICTTKTVQHYPVGLTSLVEAMAMGKPVITTDNPYYGIDVEKEGFGIKIPYGDVEGWVKATHYLSDHKDLAMEMGKKARKLAEERYNIDNCTKVLAEELLKWKREK